MADRDHDRTQKNTEELLYSGLRISATWWILFYFLRMFTYSWHSFCLHHRSWWHQESFSTRSSAGQTGPPWPSPCHWCSWRTFAGLWFSPALYLCIERLCKHCIYILTIFHVHSSRNQRKFPNHLTAEIWVTFCTNHLRSLLFQL